MTRKELLDSRPDLVESINRKRKDKVFIRTCQHCGNEQIAKDPATYKDDKWRDIKCRKCKGEGTLDYGSDRNRCPYTEEEAKFINDLDELEFQEEQGNEPNS